MSKYKIINNEELDLMSKYILIELKNQRKIQNLTLKEVASALDISVSNLNRIENGHGLKTSIQYIIKIAAYYGIEIDTLINNAMVKYNLDYPDNNKG
ncbi:helix-turn-helix transcriptional regulator [Staphylococcus sciuri]|uniref:helix-turn-helix domain-containing protein n=1 Tax=Mammaliicoccus sciuri TaxID=1296 RepID=UPI0018CBCCA3|nr:helix-turn-helix transcriptional regulator [Mammaliicoccus sciuri]MBG9206874.1 helix-turn-helix transcriptional regulator [Mammaliicoccus sciuri]